MGARHRGPGRPPRISHQAIVDAAREQVDSGLTMTAVAERLDVTVAALYRYFPDRDALVAGVAGDIVASLDVPPPDLHWREWLHRLAVNLRALILDHPIIADVRSWPGAGQAGVHILETGLQVLTEAGFDTRAALDAYHLVTYLAWQSAQLTMLQRGAGGRLSAEQYRRRVDEPLPPNFDAALPELLAYDVDEAFTTHLAWTLRGIPEPGAAGRPRSADGR